MIEYLASMAIGFVVGFFVVAIGLVAIFAQKSKERFVGRSILFYVVLSSNSTPDGFFYDCIEAIYLNREAAEQHAASGNYRIEMFSAKNHYEPPRRY